MHCWWAARTMSLRWLEETGTTTGWVTADVCVRWWISSIVSLVRCTIKITKIYFSKNRFEKEFSFPVIRAIPRNVQRYYLLAADHHLGNFWRSSARIITITLCITRQIIHTFVESVLVFTCDYYEYLLKALIVQRGGKGLLRPPMVLRREEEAKGTNPQITLPYFPCTCVFNTQF